VDKVRLIAETKQYVFRVGVPVKPRDEALLKSMISFMAAVRADISTLYPAPKAGYDLTEQAFTSWLGSWETFNAYEFGHLIDEVDTAFKAIINDPDRLWVGCLNYKDFKRSLRCPSVHWRYIACVKGYMEDFFETGNWASFYVVSQWVNFPRRVNLESADLQADLEAKYMAFEHELHAQSYEDDVVLEELATIIETWFKEFDLSVGFQPKHGPGSVSGYTGRMPAGDKDLIMQADSSLRYMSKYLPYSVDDYSCFAMEPLDERCSELVCVPKSLTKLRTISREPVALQYFQQGVRSSMVRYISHHPFLSHHIHLDDQTASRDLALEGSQTWGAFATVDLSSASDSVTTTLVYRLFRHVRPLVYALCCTRSRYTKLSDGTKVHMEKFAPMGSATCFVTMTVILTACCELALRRTLASEESGRDYRVPCTDLRRYLVYGDDIVIHASLWGELLNILTALHFQVNTTKSYYAESFFANYREACGGEYMDGHDVAPVRIPRFFGGPAELVSDPGAGVASYVQFANNAFHAKMPCLRRTILRELRQHLPSTRYLLYDLDGTRGIATEPQYCTNFHVKSRFRSHGLQEREYRVMQLIAKPDCRACKRNAEQVGRECKCPVKAVKNRSDILPEDIESEGIDVWELTRLFHAELGDLDAPPFDTERGRYQGLVVQDRRPACYCPAKAGLQWRWVIDPWVTE
jgi:hypothetical protein